MPSGLRVTLPWLAVAPVTLSAWPSRSMSFRRTSSVAEPSSLTVSTSATAIGGVLNATVTFTVAVSVVPPAETV